MLLSPIRNLVAFAQQVQSYASTTLQYRQVTFRDVDILTVAVYINIGSAAFVIQM